MHEDYKKTFEFDYETELSITLYLNSLNNNGDIDFQALNHFAEIHDIENTLELSERCIVMRRASKHFESKLEDIANPAELKAIKERIENNKSRRRYKK